MVLVAPACATPWNAIGYSGTFGAKMPTTSCCCRPRSTRPAAQRPTRWSSIAYEYDRPVEPQTIAVRSPREAASAYTNGVSGTSGISTSGYGLRMLVAIVCSSSRSVCAPAIVPLRGTPRKGVVPFGHAEAGSRHGCECDLADRKRSGGALGLASGHAERRESHRAARFRIDRGVHVAADGAEERFGKKAARRMDRAGRLAAVTAAMALDDAGDLGLESRDIGTAIGSAHGGAETLHEAYETFYLRGADRLSPFAIPLSLPNTAASAVARENNLHGPSTSIGTACAAGSDAIGAAFRLIRDGFAEAMVAGGAEAAMTPFVIAGYRKLGALSAGDGDPTLRVAAVRPRPRRIRDGRGLRHPRARGARARPGTRRADPGRGGGVRPVVRCRPSDRPGRVGSGPGAGGAPGHRRRRARAGGRSATSTPTPRRRRPATSPSCARWRRRACRTRRSRPPSRCTATPWERPVASRRWRR